MMNDQSHSKPVLWYIKKSEKITGPFPVKLIGSYLILGRIDTDTLVSMDKSKWIPIARLPSLIPDEVKQSHLAGRKAGLHQAKLREDERRGDIRREAHQRQTDDGISDGRRQPGERRKNKEEVSSSYLKLKSDFSAQRVKTKRLTLYGVVSLVIVVSVLMISFLLLDPVIRVADTDCSVKPAAGIDWQSCNKISIDLVSMNLEKSNLQSTRLTGALLVKTNFSAANLSYAGLENANLSQANLNRTLLVGANLNNANLSNADLSGADLSYADLTNAMLSNVLVQGTRFDHAIWTDGERCARQSVDRCIPEVKK
ncbi:MAG: pentapeptide repeat-containing protein [Gammaproteobacteria bacterium]|nr:pentapeptide repeat-containing protein [Gammaproteobacteria bacterium]